MAGVYPPPDQVLSAMGIEVSWQADDNLIGRALVDTSLLGRDGLPPGVGSLVPAVDLVAGSRVARVAEGDWLATSDVWLYERAPLETGPLDVATRLLRVGKRSSVVAVEVSAGGRPVADSTIEFSRIRRDATPLDTQKAPPTGEWIRLGSGDLLSAPLDQACGFRIVDADAGVVELDRHRFVNNSIGTLQGGVIAMMADVAATAVAGPGSRAVELHFRFLDQTGDGPARSAAKVVRRDAAGLVVAVEIVDTSTGRLVAWASCRVESAAGGS